eukprot:9616753-Prorocentrum_lima.AAC.1
MGSQWSFIEPPLGKGNVRFESTCIVHVGHDGTIDVKRGPPSCFFCQTQRTTPTQFERGNRQPGPGWRTLSTVRASGILFL